MTAHDPLCGFSDRHREDCTCPFHDPATCPYCIPLRAARADEREKVAPVVNAARAWVERIIDPPNLWADAEDFALIEAVKALG